MRKTTTKLLAGILGLVAFAAPLCVWAGSQDGVLSMLLGAASLGDDGDKSPHKLADQYLREARQAMQDGDFDTANAKIAQAETLEVKYSALHLGDTPKKARAALDKVRRQGALPSQRATPQDTAKKAGKNTPHDPFLSQKTEPAAASPANNAYTSAPNSPMAGNSPMGPMSPMQTPSSQPFPQPSKEPSHLGNRYAAALPSPADASASAGPTTPAVNASPYSASPATPGLMTPDQAERSTVGGMANAAAPNAPMLLPPTSAAPAASPYGAPAATATPANIADKQRAVELTKQARAALDRGDMVTAEQFARQAMPLVPDSAYGPQDERPGMVLLDIQKRKASPSATQPVAGAPLGDRYGNTQAIYMPDRDSSRNTQAGGNPMPNPAMRESYDRSGMSNQAAPYGVRQAQNTEPALPLGDDLPRPMDPTEPAADAAGGEGLKWYRKGVDALSQGNAPEALAAFRRAYGFQAELDPVTRQRLQDHLQVLGSPVEATPAPLQSTSPMAPAAAANPAVNNTTRQIFAEVSKQQSLARDMREKQPKQALALLERTKEMVATATEVDQASREQLIRRLDMSMNELRQFIGQNASQIELDEQNRAVEDENKRMQQQKVEIDSRIAKMVDDFNKLSDEGRFAEAQVVAKRAAELAPNDPLAVQLYWTSRFLERSTRNTQVRNDKEEGFWRVLQEVDESAVPFAGEYAMPPVEDWKRYQTSRYRQKQEGQFRKTPKDIEIERRLSTPVSLKFPGTPLSEVVNYLGKIANVPMYLDPEGMKAEGVSSDTPITIDLTQDISLKSALKLILEPLHLTYIVKDEVLKITTEDQRRGQLYEVVYPVGDLVIPIPNFAPNGREGINAAMREAYDRQLGFAGANGGGFGWNSPPYMASNQQNGKGNVNPNVLAQVGAGPGVGVVPIGNGGPPNSGVPQSVPFGPGGLQGGSQADFDPLIDLITGTIATQTWSELGGAGTIEGFDTTLSLVVSQTQEVHEQIADLLTQLRRLQDLQVTIEVRFITLRDEFFERIGFDFDFNIGSNTGPLPGAAANDPGPPPSFGGTVSPSRVVGLGPTGAITPNQDVQFRQDSFATALPPFGGFDPTTSGAATFGFAILSDIEAFFLVTAAQGDERANILQAPKVTLFNGQQATVSDQTQRPFVISVTPVVGDFAVGQQPVIVVLAEGTSLTVQAVVSDNRRFVRLTVVPFFSQIGDVEEFTFEGTKTTKKSSSEDKKGDDEESKSDDEEVTESGTTVQLPEFSFVSVTTTVSVPDGGTVLLGGIKRLAEGRTERGVPILAKMPYINRLFRNVGIGRTTSSLMMMVTPRIIIQEEEEENLLGTAPAP